MLCTLSSMILWTLQNNALCHLEIRNFNIVCDIWYYVQIRRSLESLSPIYRRFSSMKAIEGYNIEVHHRNTKISKYKKPRCRPQYWCNIGTHRSSFYSNLLIHAKLLRRLLVRLWQRKLALPGHAGGQSGFHIIVMLAIWLVYMISVKYALSLLSAVW